MRMLILATVATSLLALTAAPAFAHGSDGRGGQRHDNAAAERREAQHAAQPQRRHRQPYGRDWPSPDDRPGLQHRRHRYQMHHPQHRWTHPRFRHPGFRHHPRAWFAPPWWHWQRR